METNQQNREVQYTLTMDGKGGFHPIDPRTGKEPAGSALLARSAAVRGAQEAALRKVIAADVWEQSNAFSDSERARFSEFVERQIIPKTLDIVEHREVVGESRDDEFYYVTLKVVFDSRALRSALEQFNLKG